MSSIKEGGHLTPHKIFVYRTISWVYLIGCSKDQDAWTVLKLSRQDLALTAVEDGTVYNKVQIDVLLRTLHEGNRAHGGLQLVCKALALAGCFRFLEGYYLLLVTKRTLRGLICGGHKVYSIAGTLLLPLLHPMTRVGLKLDTGVAEARYRKIFSGLQLNESFLYST
ncbi:hypothetical protein H632_c1626p0, partial [Helicosporidium sp. ATCC 50920]